MGQPLKLWKKMHFWDFFGGGLNSLWEIFINIFRKFEIWASKCNKPDLSIFFSSKVIILRKSFKVLLYGIFVILSFNLKIFSNYNFWTKKDREIWFVAFWSLDFDLSKNVNKIPQSEFKPPKKSKNKCYRKNMLLGKSIFSKFQIPATLFFIYEIALFMTIVSSLVLIRCP